MQILVILLVTAVVSEVHGLQEVSNDNFWSVYFSNIWKVIVRKFTEVKEFFEREVPKLVQMVEEEVPKFVHKVETDVPKFVEDLHIKEKTEAISNATTKVKRYFADWDEKLRCTVDSFRDVFIVVAVVFALAMVSYLYVECTMFRKLFLAIPKLLCHIVVRVLKRKKKKVSAKECHNKGCVHMV
ncbi:hypothetical protein QR680_018546 [Steinernema hermaphroditum]|uniref:Uncharacterized protein n=1 Tax=Steinernema hermaphroditum TaxID=289476 RepID=A0AA39HIA4_9BILA|nr:hypothetical protein QR680_018546 [Steinernema hermaphroditum]